MILTDGTHLVSDASAVELHGFARSIGLKAEWFQGHARHPHYDLTSTRMARKALQGGAVLVSGRHIVERLRVARGFSA